MTCMMSTRANIIFCVTSVKARGPESVTGALVRGVVPPRADVKQLEEAKQMLEGQLDEISLQLERDGYTSVAQMRYTFVSEMLHCCTVGVEL